MVSIARSAKRILFISLNGHQRRYFNTLGKYLQDSYQIYHVDYSSITFKDIWTNQSLHSLSSELNMTEQEIEEIIRFLLIKGTYRKFGLIRRYLHSRRVLEAQAYGALNFFYNYITENKIDLVCVWNGTLVPLGAATRVAKKLHRKTLFFENGYLPNTTTVDPLGVNYYNSIVGKPRSFYDEIDIDYEKLNRLYDAKPAIRALKTKWYHLKKKKQGDIENIQLPHKFIFVPFQVHDDTQVLLNSPVIKTMTELLQYVVPAVDDYNKKNCDSVRIIVKEHPSDFGRIDYSDLRQKYEEKVVFLRYFPTPELIKASAGIITINSSVGIEALVQHKPVITLGNAFYNVQGLTVNVSDPSSLSDVISTIFEPTDDILIDKFLYYLRYHYLAEGSWRQPNDAHLACVKNKVASILMDD